MTHNQVAYFEARAKEAANLEAARHNKAQEKLTGEQIEATRAYNELQAVNTARSIAETERHNRTSEYIQAGQLEAQRLYNEAQLQIANANLLLAGRQQSTREYTLEETKRANTAKEAEQGRHNVVVEQQTTVAEGNKQKQNLWSNLLRVGETVVGAAQAVGIALLNQSYRKSRYAEE